MTGRDDVDELHLEGSPDDGQKERLEDFLTELMLISRKHRILLHDRDETVEIVDMPTGHLIGLGLGLFTAPQDDHHVRCYVAADSILDGAWLVDSADGPDEQRHVMNVLPRRASAD